VKLLAISVLSSAVETLEDAVPVVEIGATAVMADP
jgi:hypothetical protein